MNASQSKEFANEVLIELERQSQSFAKMQSLILTRSVPSENQDHSLFRNVDLKRRMLVELIDRHHRLLQDFKNNSRNLSHHIPVETQREIQARIEEIVDSLKDIVGVEKENCGSGTAPLREQVGTR